jgi:hypothetical protein
VYFRSHPIKGQSVCPQPKKNSTGKKSKISLEKPVLPRSCPMPKEILTSFFNYLDQQLTEQGCDDTLRFTKEFAEEHQLAFGAIRVWLSNYGGYCDCEVSANVEEHFEGL